MNQPDSHPQTPSAAAEEAPPSPVARLELSRQRLRAAMQRGRHGRRGDPSSENAGPATGRDSKWRRSLAAIPGMSIVVDALESWWLQHPLRVAAMIGSEAAHAVFEPAAKRRPLTLVVGALAVGAAVAWAKPWRWGLLRPALFTGLVTQFASKALAQVPVASWLAVLSELVPQQPRHASAPESPLADAAGPATS